MQRLALIALLIPNYDDAIAFFTGPMGFDLLEDTDLGGDKRWVRVAPPGAQTAFLLACAVGDQRQMIGQQGGGRVWLFLQTDDFTTDYVRMSDNGIAFEESPRTEPYGTVAVFRDPWGNRWDLVQLTS